MIPTLFPEEPSSSARHQAGRAAASADPTEKDELISWDMASLGVFSFSPLSEKPMTAHGDGTLPGAREAQQNGKGLG